MGFFSIQDPAMTDAEDVAYAAREAQAPHLARFEGGDAVGFVLGVLLVAALVLLIYYLIVELHHRH